jgi:hypothetical protein
MDPRNFLFPHGDARNHNEIALVSISFWVLPPVFTRVQRRYSTDMGQFKQRQIAGVANLPRFFCRTAFIRPAFVSLHLRKNDGYSVTMNFRPNRG